jgi:hypothetical protein
MMETRLEKLTVSMMMMETRLEKLTETNIFYQAHQQH